MRTWGIATIGIAIVGFLAAPAAVAQEGGSKPLSVIVKRVEADGYYPVEIELEKGEWEIEAYKQGEKFELHVDAVTGEVLSTKPD